MAGASRTGAARPTRTRSAGPQPVVVTTAVAVILAVAYLAAPHMGQDLSAQQAHADFARDHPLLPVDFRWFGGTLPFGYSLTVPLLSAVVGVRLLGAIALVLGSLLTATLLVRTRVLRPTVGGVLAAVTGLGNLTEGRVAFGVAVVLGLAALVPLTGRRGHRGAVVVLAFLAGSANPVAGLFLGLIALTLLLHGRWREAVALGAGAAAGIAVVSLLFADGGPFVYSPADAARAAAVAVIVAVVVPRNRSTVWTAAVLTTAMVAVAYFGTTPVGANASRLPMLAAVPLIGALVAWRPAWKVAAVVLVVAVVQPPFVVGTLAAAGAPPTRAAYFAPVVRAVEARGPVNGRVEIPELTGHWEAQFVAARLPLARGWLRQVDIALYDDVFYSHAPTTTSYRMFLQRSATRYVAVPSAPLTFYGRREAALVATNLPYLSPVWSDATWRLYAVTDPVPVVGAPGTGAALDAAAVRFDAPAHSSVDVDVRWFSWLSLESADDGACLARDGDRVVVRTDRGGSYTVTSTLLGSRRRC